MPFPGMVESRRLNLATTDGRTEPVVVRAYASLVSVDVQAPAGTTWTAELELSLALTERDLVDLQLLENWRSFPDERILLDQADPLVLGVEWLAAGYLRLATTIADPAAGLVKVVFRWGG